ncbi:MAG: glycosyltransferase [Burkholderiaceae bacterium]
MQKISISVVMPVYNTGHYLSEAVESVLTQQGLDDVGIELLVVDDRSTDPATLAVLQSLTHSDPRIRVLRNEGCKGVSGARNLGIREARGEWIAFMDSDDYFLPDALASHWQLAQSTPSAQWIAGQFFLLRGADIDRTDLARRSPNLYSLIGENHRLNLPTRLERPVDAFARNCILAPPAVLIKRELIVRKGMFDEGLKRAEDYHLWFKCAVDTDLWIIPKEVYIHRFREGSLTTSNEPIFFHEHRMLDLLLEDPSFASHRSALLRRFDVIMADYCHYFRANRAYATAAHWAVIWLSKRPSHVAAWKQLVASTLHR